MNSINKKVGAVPSWEQLQNEIETFILALLTSDLTEDRGLIIFGLCI